MTNTTSLLEIDIPEKEAGEGERLLPAAALPIT